MAKKQARQAYVDRRVACRRRYTGNVRIGCIEHRAKRRAPVRQWRCLKALFTHESGWRHWARNPSTGAAGIPQRMPRIHGIISAAWWRSPLRQVRWGLGYVRARYGTACGAWRFWLSRRPHWY